MYDLIIKNGKIIDGTGSPYYRADIALQGGRIARIAKHLEGADQIIDASGLVVTPGFIDSHSHADTAVLTYPDQIEKVEQGITTSIGGQCGSSPAPISREVDPANAPQVGQYGRATDVYRTMGTFLDIAKEVPQGANIAMFVGHSALRKAVMGTANRAATPDELEQMKDLLRDAMEHGALGVSFGLIYAPSCYAQTDELIALAKIAGEYHGLAAAHIRNESDQLVESVDEFITVLRQADIRGVLSHHKSTKRPNWGKVTHTLRMLEQANAEGVEIYCDVYPYRASHTTLSATLIPREFHSGGTAGLVSALSDPEQRSIIKKQSAARLGTDLSYILITSCKAYPEYLGLRLSEIADLRGGDHFDAAFDLIRDSENVCSACYFTMCQEDVETVMAYPRAMICTDSGVARSSLSYHPRLRGTFPRVLGRYVRERGVTSLPEMIRKMTSMPACVYGLKGKGLILEGYDADLCIFDPDKIIDRADFTNCTRGAEGLNYVLIGGRVVAENAVYNGIRMGRVLLRRD